MIAGAGPWGTGPYMLIEGFSTPEKRTNRIILEANTKYWDESRMPRLKRIIFDNTIEQKEAVERVKRTEGRIDLVTELSPLDTLGVTQSQFAKVVKRRDSLSTVAISCARRWRWSMPAWVGRRPMSLWNSYALA